MATASKDLAKAPTSPFAIMQTDPRELAAALRDVADGQRLSPWSLDVVKVPAGGVTVWTVPTLEGVTNVPTIEGIVIYQRTIRSFWKQSISAGGGNPPDCSSQDGSVGIGDPGPAHPDYAKTETKTRFDASGEPWEIGRYACVDCGNAQFGSKVRDDGGQGRGQACKQAKLLFLIQPESVLPLIVSTPPSSLKLVRQFFLRMTGQNIPPFGAVVRLGLEKTKNADGIAYAQIVPSFVRRLEDGEKRQMVAALEELRPIFAGVRVDVDDD